MYGTHDFSNRVGLSGHTSPETAYVVEDYPYGFRERTSIRYWVEYKASHGFRKMSQTLNPKTGKWNKPKASTYYPVMVLIQMLDTGYIECHTLGTHEPEDNIAAFEAFYADSLTDAHRNEIRGLRVINRAFSKLTVTVGPSDPDPDVRRAQREEDRRNIHAAFAQAAREIPA